MLHQISRARAWRRKTAGKGLLATSAVALVAGLAMAPVAGAAETERAAVIEEITVTAQKRSENLQDVPIAITAHTAESMTVRGMSNIADIGDFTPNLEMDATSSFSGSTQVLTAYIRGIGQNDFAFNLDPGVGVYVDGVFYARTIGAVVDLLDLDHVEVLKGPQGTLFGRNTIGGAISVVTRDPADEFQARGDVTVGRYSRIDIRGSLDVPLVGDKLLSQLSFSSKSRSGYHKFLEFPGSRDFITDVGRFVRPFDTTYDKAGGENNQNVRAKLKLRASDRLTVRITGDYTHVNEQGTPNELLGTTPGGLADIYNLCISTPVAAFDSDPGLQPFKEICTSPRANIGSALAGVNVDDDPGNDHLVFDDRFIPDDIDTSYSTGAGYSKLTAWGITTTVDWAITDVVNLKSITAYRALDSAFALDDDGTPIPIGDHAFTMNQEQVSQELQLTGTSFGDALHWVAGLYFFHEQGSLTDFVHFAGGLLQILGPNYFNTDSYAAYTNLNYQLSERLGLTFGGRFTRDRKKFEGGQRDLNALAFKLGFPPFLAPDPSDGTLYFPPGVNRLNFSDFSFKAGLEFRIAEDALSYFSYSQGFKSGGWTTRATVPILTAPSFRPERASTYEIGFKGQFFDNRLQTNTAAYYTNYDDLQVTVQLGVSPVTENAAKARIKGFEVEVTALVTDRLRVQATVGYTDAKYTRLNPGTLLQTDFLFLNTPKFEGTISGDYTVPLQAGSSLSVHADFVHKSRIANDGENTPLLIAGRSNVVNAVIAYDSADGRWRLAFGARNLTNERFIVAGHNQPGIGYVGGTYNRPREWYLRTSFQY